MSAYHTDYPVSASQQPSYPPRQPLDSEEDLKAPYDDLIDQYAAPYAASNRHQTFAVDAPPLSPTKQHRRGVSYKLSEYETKSSEDAAPRAYPPPMPTIEKDSRTFWAKILPESLACRLYVVTVLVETAIDLAIEGDILLRFQKEKNKNPNASNTTESNKMPVYLFIFALAHVFQFAMACDAVYNRNTLQFLALTIFNALLLIYAIIQKGEVQDALNEITLPDGVSHIPIGYLTTIIPIVIAVAEVAYMALGWKIYNEFGWKVYKFLGADRRIKKMYAHYQIFECLMKFDLFFFVGFSVQFIWLVLNNDKSWEYYVTYAALPLSIVLLIEGHLAARHENRWMMATFMSGCVGALVYFVYKLVKVMLYRTTAQFFLIWRTLTIFSVIAIILLLATFVMAFVVISNFGRGLKAQMDKNKSGPTAHSRWGSQHVNRSMSVNPNRMSID